MSSHATTSDSSASKPLDLSRFRNLPYILGALGLVGAILGYFNNPKQFAYSYLLAYVFFLSICVGCWFLTLIHHLFDAAWSVPFRRIVEHVSVLLFPTMAVLFIPIALMAPTLYPWMQIVDPATDHALHPKEALLNKNAWYGISAAIFLVWWFFSRRLRYWSLRQDETGSAECTYKMRFLSCLGIFFFAISVTMAIILWVKAIEHAWFSTMYGVYYFAESVWTTLATVYVIMMLLQKAGPLKKVILPKQVHSLGLLWFAFTVFYAYIHFSQYFIIWNANVPEETFHYVMREKGGWWEVGLLIIFGHFFIPFLLLLRIDWKMKLAVTFPLAVWAWIMHFCDVSYNIMPVLHPDGFVLHWMDIACLAFVGSVLAIIWLKHFASHPPFPQKDPRMSEALGIYHPQASPIAAVKYEGKP